MIFDNATIITMNPGARLSRMVPWSWRSGTSWPWGRAASCRERFPHHTLIDCSGDVLLPGLIDTHVHTAQAMLSGCANDLTLLDWLGKRVWVLQGSYTAEDGRASAALCTLEMIKSGTTSFIEAMLAERYGIDGVAEVVLQSGMRAAIGKIVMDKPSYAGRKSSCTQG